jgi:hypothetical protein
LSGDRDGAVNHGAPARSRIGPDPATGRPRRSRMFVVPTRLGVGAELQAAAGGSVADWGFSIDLARAARYGHCMA